MNERLEEIRKYAQMSKKNFAEKISISSVAYHNYVQGKRQIPSEIAIKINELFDVSIDWLLTGKGEMFLSENSSNKIVKKINGGNNNIAINQDSEVNQTINNNIQNNKESKEIDIKTILNSIEDIKDVSILKYLDNVINTSISKLELNKKYGESLGI